MYENNMDIKNLRGIMPDANEFILERVKKVNQLRKKGINPYPYSYKNTTHSNYILENFDNINETQSFSLAGRIMLLRRMGKVTFLDLRDQEGDIQVYLSKTQLGEERYDVLKLVDVGDIIGAQGTVFKTQTGEITIKAAGFEVLSKSIRPLPEKYHGIQDADLKVRHRSLDMIMNNDVKKRFINRSKAMSAIREFFTSRSFYEVETPVLDMKYGGGEAKPFITRVNCLDSEVYMCVSHELYLKRLMVGGIERVFTIGKSFRNEGIDRTHYPEFTLLECYMAYGDYSDMMEIMEQLYEFVFNKVNGSTKVTYDGLEIDFKAPWKRERMCDLVKQDTGIDVEKLGRDDIFLAVNERGLLKEIEGVEGMSKGDLIMNLFDEYSAAKLIQPTFVIDFPLDSSPLCKVHRQNPELIERFEPYAYGVELGNAYSELNDALRQRILLNDQANKLRAGMETASPMDEEFAVAVDSGMPPAGGLGIGIDRLIMFLTNAYSIKDVIAFPIVKR